MSEAIVDTLFIFPGYNGYQGHFSQYFSLHFYCFSKIYPHLYTKKNSWENTCIYKFFLVRSSIPLIRWEVCWCQHTKLTAATPPEKLSEEWSSPVQLLLYYIILYYIIYIILLFIYIILLYYIIILKYVYEMGWKMLSPQKGKF